MNSLKYYFNIYRIALYYNLKKINLFKSHSNKNGINNE